MIMTNVLQLYGYFFSDMFVNKNKYLRPPKIVNSPLSSKEIKFGEKQERSRQAVRNEIISYADVQVDSD